MDPQQLLFTSMVALHEDLLLAQPRYQEPESLVRFRTQVYSQNGEDGMIAEIFRRLGAGQGFKGFFVELGAGDGAQNNTRFLLECGWAGVWAEADAGNLAAIRACYAQELAVRRLQLIAQPLCKENAVALVDGPVAGREIDLLSIDIDMNTSHVWRALALLAPRVAVIEYNATIPPSVEWEVDYDPAAVWQGDNRYGASLKRLEALGKFLGYRLVGCDLAGVNAFFVRKDLHDARLEQFPAATSAEFHYEPQRLSLLLKTRHQPWMRPKAPPVLNAA